MSFGPTPPAELGDPIAGSGLDEHGAPPEQAVGRAMNPASRALFLLFTLFFFPSTVLMIGLATGARGNGATMLLYAVATLAIGLLPTAIDQARPPERRNFMFSFFVLWFMISFVVPVFSNYLPAGAVAIPGSVSAMVLAQTETIRGQSIALMALIVLMAGYFFPLSGSVGRAIPGVKYDWPPNVLLAVAMGMLVMGFTIRAGGLLGLIPTSVGTGFISALASAATYANVALTIAIMRDRSLISMVFLVISVLLTSAIGFLSGSKTGTLIAPAMVGLTVMMYRRQIRWTWLVAGFAVLIVMYPTSIFYREAIIDGGRIPVTEALSNLGGVLNRLSLFVGSGNLGQHVAEGLSATGNRIDGLGVSSVIIRDTPAVVPYQNGRTLGLFFVAFVPRIFWPEKPEIPIGQWINLAYTGGENDTYFGPTAIGDFYLNFGIPGVIGGMFLFGFILRCVYETLLARKLTAPGLIAAIVLLYQLCLKFESNIAIAWSTAVFALFPIFVTHTALRLFGISQPVEVLEAQRARATEAAQQTDFSHDFR